MIHAAHTSYSLFTHNKLVRQVLLDQLLNEGNEAHGGKVCLSSWYHADSQKSTKYYLCVLKALMLHNLESENNLSSQKTLVSISNKWNSNNVNVVFSKSFIFANSPWEPTDGKYWGHCVEMKIFLHICCLSGCYIRK